MDGVLVVVVAVDVEVDVEILGGDWFKWPLESL